MSSDTFHYRFILASTEKLHEKIQILSERVRQLEEGLETLQGNVSPETHPLLAPELLAIKNSQGLYGNSTSLPQTYQQRDESLRESVGAMSLSSVAEESAGVKQPPYRTDVSL